MYFDYNRTIKIESWIIILFMPFMQKLGNISMNTTLHAMATVPVVYFSKDQTHRHAFFFIKIHLMILNKNTLSLPCMNVISLFYIQKYMIMNQYQWLSINGQKWIIGYHL